MILSIPYSFSPNTLAYSSQVNANFAAIVAVVNGGLDNSNVGPLGFYPSQMIPLTNAQATFGGVVGYKFPTPLSASANSSTIASVPPVYTAAGAATGGNEHMVRGSVSISLTSGTNNAQVNVTLSGAAAFSSSTTFTLKSNIVGGLPYLVTSAGSSFAIEGRTRVSGTTMQFSVGTANGSNVTSTYPISIDWEATGY